MSQVAIISPSLDALLETHDYLMSFSRGQSNDDLLARMLASSARGDGVLSSSLGLSSAEYAAMIQRHFPGAIWALPYADPSEKSDRWPELDDLYQLLMKHRADVDESERWVAEVIASACMGSDHLWQDMGLWTRADLSALISRNFPALAARNDQDMKWKKFLYKQLCLEEGIYTCRSPSCETCADYDDCFGSED